MRPISSRACAVAECTVGAQSRHSVRLDLYARHAGNPRNRSIARSCASVSLGRFIVALRGWICKGSRSPTSRAPPPRSLSLPSLAPLNFFQPSSERLLTHTEMNRCGLDRRGQPFRPKHIAFPRFGIRHPQSRHKPITWFCHKTASRKTPSAPPPIARSSAPAAHPTAHRAAATGYRACRTSLATVAARD